MRVAHRQTFWKYDALVRATRMSATVVVDHYPSGRIRWAAFAGQNSAPLEEEEARRVFPEMGDREPEARYDTRTNPPRFVPPTFIG